MGCRFCATGTMGFKSNLSSGKIVEQLVHASRYSRLADLGLFRLVSTYFLSHNTIQSISQTLFDVPAEQLRCFHGKFNSILSCLQISIQTKEN
jgi:hypothetical protein